MAGGRDEAGKLIPIDIKAGDRALFGKWSGTEVKIDGEELLIMKSSVEVSHTRLTGGSVGVIKCLRTRLALAVWRISKALPELSASTIPYPHSTMSLDSTNVFLYS